MRKAKKTPKPKKQAAYFITAEYFESLVENTFGQQIHFYNETEINNGSGVYPISTVSFVNDEKEILSSFIDNEEHGLGESLIISLLKELVKRKVLSKGTYVIATNDC